MDSDREWQGAKAGDTFRCANTAYKKVKKNHMINMYELGVREKENLMSPSMYLLVSNRNTKLLEILNEEILDEKIIKYFDIKDGIKYKRRKNVDWVAHYNKILDKAVLRGIYSEPSEEDPKKDEHLCIEGIGADLSDLARKVLLEDDMSIELMKQYGIYDDKIQLIFLKKEYIVDELPNYLKNEWEDISDLLFSWGCCISSSKLPIYGF